MCGVYLVLVGLVGVSLNSLVCLLFMKCKKVFSSLTPPATHSHCDSSSHVSFQLMTDFNILLLNLVVTEGGGGCFFFTFFLYSLSFDF